MSVGNIHLRLVCLRIIVGIVTGHCRLNDLVERLEISSDADCRFYGEGDETSVLHAKPKCAVPMRY